MPATVRFADLLNASGGEDGPTGPAIAAALRDSGLLAEMAELTEAGADPLPLFRTLVEVGRISLSAGRILEGHVNALKLLRLYGRSQYEPTAGDLLGIWGADGPDPARIEGDVLRGQKLFASGADVLTGALVTVRDGERIRLLFFTRDRLEGRLFPGEWAVSGMKATASGRCNLEGVRLSEARFIGEPDDYLVEPHFQGGVWRYAAVQLGAMFALTGIVARQLRQRGQEDAPLQLMRLRRMVTACETCRLWLENAARAVERPGAEARDAEGAILARLLTAEEAVAVLNAADQSLGASSFATGHPAERIRRDLGFYLRQADPDGLGQGAMTRLLADRDLSKRWLG